MNRHATGFAGAHGSAGLGLGHRFVNGGMKGPQKGAAKLIWFGFRVLLGGFLVLNEYFPDKLGNGAAGGVLNGPEAKNNGKPKK